MDGWSERLPSENPKLIRVGRSAACDSGKYLDLSRVCDLRGQTLGKANVFASHVDIDEPPQLPVVVGKLLPQLGMARKESLENRADIVS